MSLTHRITRSADRDWCESPSQRLLRACVLYLERLAVSAVTRRERDDDHRSDLAVVMSLDIFGWRREAAAAAAVSRSSLSGASCSARFCGVATHTG